MLTLLLIFEGNAAYASLTPQEAMVVRAAIDQLFGPDGPWPIPHTVEVWEEWEISVPQ